jgi:hypothetical protein
VAQPANFGEIHINKVTDSEVEMTPTSDAPGGN